MGNTPVIEENSFVSVGAERLMMEANTRTRLFTASHVTRHPTVSRALTFIHSAPVKRSTRAYPVKFSAPASESSPNATFSES